jgi:tRNA 2-thiouridine synthesizing protein A
MSESPQAADHYELDARGLLCPLPVIRTQQRVAELARGDVLTVLCTDPGAANDIPAWCRVNGHAVVEIRDAADGPIVVVQVG